MSFADRLKHKMIEIRKATIATDEVAEERLAICNECPQLFKATMTCKECGCFMKAKSKLATAECPLKKW